MLPNRLARLRQALTGFAVCGACGHVTAAEWSIQPELQWRMDHDSNRRLAVNGEQPSDGSWLLLDSTFKRATETLAVDLHPHLEVQRFSGDSALDSQNGSLSGSLQRVGERTSYNLTGSYERASTLTTELADTGVVDASTRRNTASGSVGIAHDFSETRHLDLSGTYTDVRYPDGLRLGLVGYRYPSLTAHYTLGLSERTSLSAIAFGDRVTAPLTGYVSREVGVRLAGSHSFTMRIKWYASIGISQTQVLSETQHGYVWELRASRDSQLGQWGLSHNRSVQPSGRGVLVRRDDLAVSLSQSIAPKLYATLSVHDIRNANLASGPFLEVPRYFTGDAGLEWRLSTQWVVDLTGGMSEDRQPTNNEIARGWRAALNTRWTPAAWSSSR